MVGYDLAEFDCTSFTYKCESSKSTNKWKLNVCREMMKGK